MQALLEHGLIDERRLMIVPVILGGGKHGLRVTETRTVGDGVTILVYERP